MGPELPEVADPASGGRVHRDDVVLGGARLLGGQAIDEPVDLGDGKPGDPDVEVEVGGQQGFQLVG